MSYNDQFPAPHPTPRSDEHNMHPLGPYVPYVPHGQADTAIPFATLRRAVELAAPPNLLPEGVDLRQVDMREVDFFDPNNMRVLSRRGCNPLAAPFVSGALEHGRWYGWCPQF